MRRSLPPLIWPLVSTHSPLSLASPAASKYVPTGFTTATMVMEQRSDIIKLTTGCKALDDILGGAPLPLLAAAAAAAAVSATGE